MLPLIKLEQSPQQNRQIFLKSLGLMLLVATPALVLFMLLPEFVVGTLMGANYLPYASLLPLLSLAIFIISVLSLIISYFTALRRYVVAFLAIMVAVVACTFMLFHHNSLQEIVENLLYTSVIALCLVGIGVVYSNLKTKAA
jgi:O-antigen/teichoic acid export membrane protein